jgi:hypothetical protein
MKPIMIYFTEEQLQKLQENKQKTGCSIASQLRAALNEYWGGEL